MKWPTRFCFLNIPMVHSSNREEDVRLSLKNKSEYMETCAEMMLHGGRKIFGT